MTVSSNSLSAKQALASLLPSLHDLTSDMARDLGLSMSQTNTLYDVLWENWLLCRGRSMDAAGYEDVIRRLWNLSAPFLHDQYTARTSLHCCPDGTRVVCIEPEAGCTVHILLRGNGALFVDAGPRSAEHSLMALAQNLVCDLDKRETDLLITHGDIDHIGAFEPFRHIFCSGIVAGSFQRESEGGPCCRELFDNFRPAYVLYKLMTQYQTPPLQRLQIIGDPQAAPTQGLTPTGVFRWQGLDFQIYQGAGGHVAGEIVLISRPSHLVLAGDLRVNVHDILPAQVQFDQCILALLGSSDINPELAAQERHSLRDLLGPGSWDICCGHGAMLHWDL